MSPFSRYRLRILLSVAVFAGLFVSVSAFAGKDEEITHLLDYIDGSGCTFIRNGKSYPAPEARSHMERKYGHVESRIKTSDQFIEYIATRSSISGKAYQIECNGEKEESGPWLEAELARYRGQ